jgi:crossover junction endodeoxyribonuclease RusA
VILTLPYPPSTNRYWRNVQGRTLISRDGRQYRVEAVRAVMDARQDGLGRRPCRVTILCFMPDARRRDLDNVLKASLDAMQAARVFEDDAQIVKLTVERGPIDRTRPRLEVTVEAA